MLVPSLELAAGSHPPDAIVGETPGLLGNGKHGN
jgi:hypothetical protein